MSDFISSCACRGLKPRNIGSARIISRPDLVSRLMRERHVLRCLIAPSGFGKTHLAAEYAEVVFDFKHVFWIDAQSPCFLRDLDRGLLAQTIMERDSAAALVVFDDVACLETERAEALSATIDSLLSQACEVIMTTTPSADAYADLQSDRMTLRADDLLLSDAELKTGEIDDDDFAVTRHLARYQRIPLVVWGSSDPCVAFARALVQECLPTEMRLALFCMLALQEGDLGDLEQLGIALKPTAIAFLASNYPFYDIDAEGHSFSTMRFPLQVLLEATSSRLDTWARQAGYDGRDDMVHRVCCFLVKQGQTQRACDLAICVLKRANRAQWLAVCDFDLFDQQGFVEAGEVFLSIRREHTALDARLNAAHAWRLAMLGDMSAALRVARRVQKMPYAKPGSRAIAALLGARFDEGDGLQSAYGVLDELDGLRSNYLLGGDELLSVDQSEGDALFWLPLVQIQRALMRDPFEAVILWERWSAIGANASALLMAAAWITWAMREKTPEGILQRIYTEITRQCGEEGRVGMIALMAEQSYCRAREYGARARDFETRVQSKLLQARSRLQEQKAQYRKSKQASEEPISEQNALITKPKALAYVSKEPAPEGVSHLRICLFGRFDVQIGQRHLEEAAFSRQKTKTLLALLTLSMGREVPRDKLAISLWRYSNITSARKNLYTIWSALKRTIELPDGSCPYLVRMQNGFKLEKRFVESDVSRVEEFCQSVHLGGINERTWATVLAQINEAYAGDLLPSETENDDVVRLRFHYRSRVVGALITASAQLIAQAEPYGALCFAEAAFRRDHEREDVYVALMRAQIACNQRTQALATYFACRRFLAEELGIDPSAELVELYRSIIEEEASFE